MKTILTILTFLTLSAQSFAAIEAGKTYYGTNYDGDKDCSLTILKVKYSKDGEVLKFTARTDSPYQKFNTSVKNVAELTGGALYSNLPKKAFDQPLYDFSIYKIFVMMTRSALNVELNDNGDLRSYEYFPLSKRLSMEDMEWDCLFEQDGSYEGPTSYATPLSEYKKNKDKN